ncbi:hypothetical protein M378DRAFT_78934 [Amanita muscaria Koide BX008]|uniref:Palmitoyltransferase n=1 Tax=Amanita muscaria (strain Koide BX008) TaxID=946122 RepID=A0A0C2X473_AMAMK|nr:hypothetical protein M378DRAFT_78934 [Amanita muscaria Koide BX008]
MLCARTVFRCFRAVEHFADRLTGAAGPYFVGLAVVLITAGALCFFTVILPSLPFSLLTVPICFLIAANLYLHYLWVCTMPPGFADEPENPPDRTVAGWLWGKRRGRMQNTTISPAYVGNCAKCGSDKPERTHHCRICKRCILKYDHHCPPSGINQCVGLYNERHFVLFMIYFVLSTACFSGFGYQHFFLALGIYPYDWSYFLPPWVFVLVYLLSSILCLAVAIMLSFHLWGIALAETSVESHDFPAYRAKAKSRGTTFVNCYDLGKRQNLQLFFNVGPLGHSYLTLVLPLRISPYTNGRAWAKRHGLSRHQGIDASDEFTDDEEHSIIP